MHESLPNLLIIRIFYARKLTKLIKKSRFLLYKYAQVGYRKVPYGFGFRIDAEDKKTIYHHGKWNGFSTGLTQYLEHDLVVIVLEHTSYNGMTSLNKKIKKIVLDNFGS